MPLKSGSSPSTVSGNIRELHQGPTYAHTEGKFGASRANAQAIAIALNTARKSKRKGYADGGSPTLDDKAQGIAIRPLIDMPDVPSPDAGPVPDENASTTSRSSFMDKLLGLGGQERYQLWPERMVRSGVTLAHDVMSGEVPTEVMDPTTGEFVPNPEMLQRAQDMAGMAGGAGIGQMGKDAVEAATRAPSMREYWKPAAEALSDTSASGAPLAALEHAPKFYSGLEQTVNSAPMNKATGEQWLGTLANKGVKKEELEYTGTKDFLEANRDQPLTKQEVADHVAGNKVQVGEVNKGEPSWETLSSKDQHEFADRFNDLPPSRRADYDNNPREYFEDLLERDPESLKMGVPKFSSYQLPGGENYREKLLTLPASPKLKQLDDMLQSGQPMTEAQRQQRIGLEQQAYRSSHWDEPNVLVHRRTNEREVNGVPSLHIEEVQSDFMQDYRRQKMAISDAIDKDFDGIADRMVKGGAIKKVCD